MKLLRKFTDLDGCEASGRLKALRELVEITNNDVDTVVQRLSRRRCGFFSCFCLCSNYKDGKEVDLYLRRITILKEEWDELKPGITTTKKPPPESTQPEGKEEEQQSRGEEPWYLFCRSINGGKANLEDPVIRQHAKRVVTECRELPLALAALGRAFRSYGSIGEWDNAIKRLKNPPAPHQPRPGKLTIESMMRFCYDSLDNDLLRSCLLYCGLYPKDQIITELQLILGWMGEGLLDQEDGSLEFCKAYEMGLGIIRNLTEACLIDYYKRFGDFYLKMPKDVWDMTQQITDTHGIPYVDFSKNSGEFSTRLWAVATRISITELNPSLPRTSIIFNSLLSPDTTLPEDTPSCLKLRTFFAAGNKRLETIHQDFCRFIPAVLVLDLSSTNIKGIPKTINLLNQLQHLLLRETKITTLPIELGDLKKLRMLDLSMTEELEEIPSVSISRLSALQSLRMGDSRYSWDSKEGTSMENRSAILKLEDLRNLSQMQSLQLKITSIPALEQLLKTKSFICTTGLTVSGECFDEHYVEKIIGKFSFLRWLELQNCHKLEQLEILRIDLPFLHELRLGGLVKLSRISSKDGLPLFPFLRQLGLIGCNLLKNLTWAGQLPLLELLCLKGCDQITQLMSRKEEESVSITGEPFPKLHFLLLQELPELRSFSWEHPLRLPSLRTLRIRKCKRLKMLPLGKQSGKNIIEISGSKEWWDQLQWDDDTVRSNFLPYFKESDDPTP